MVTSSDAKAANQKYIKKALKSEKARIRSMVVQFGTPKVYFFKMNLRRF